MTLQNTINNCTLVPVFVYEFLYNSDTCESAPSTISIHQTRKGAEKGGFEDKGGRVSPG